MPAGRDGPRAAGGGRYPGADGPGAARVDPIIGRTVGAFVVEKKLGEGGMGAVYRLRHRELQGTYQALKVLTLRTDDASSPATAAIVDRFLQEARAAAAVGSHRVAQVFDIGEFDDGVRYLVMEYVTGRSLSDTLLARGPLPVLEALLIATRVADTLAVAHQRGIIHRDVKPSNLMMLSEGRDPVVKLLDFGIARATGDVKVAYTSERVVIGSPGYMSPEAALGGAVDGRADVFSLAVTLYEMLAGACPFAGSNMQQAIMNTITLAPPPIASLRPPALEPVSPRVEAVVQAALAKEPTARPVMATFLTALVELSDELAADQRRGAVAGSVMRAFAPAVAERPTLVPSTPDVAEVLARYAFDSQPGSPGATPRDRRDQRDPRTAPAVTPLPRPATPAPSELGAVPQPIAADSSPRLPRPGMAARPPATPLPTPEPPWSRSAASAVTAATSPARPPRIAAMVATAVVVALLAGAITFALVGRTPSGPAAGPVPATAASGAAPAGGQGQVRPPEPPAPTALRAGDPAVPPAGPTSPPATATGPAPPTSAVAAPPASAVPPPPPTAAQTSGPGATGPGGAPTGPGALVPPPVTADRNGTGRPTVRPHHDTSFRSISRHLRGLTDDPPARNEATKYGTIRSLDQ